MGPWEEQVLLTTELQIEKLEVDEIVAQSRHNRGNKNRESSISWPKVKDAKLRLGFDSVAGMLADMLGVLHWTPAAHKTWHGGRRLSSWRSGSRSRSIQSSNSSSATQGFQDQPGCWRPCLKTQRYLPPKKSWKRLACH